MLCNNECRVQDVDGVKRIADGSSMRFQDQGRWDVSTRIDVR